MWRGVTQIESRSTGLRAPLNARVFTLRTAKILVLTTGKALDEKVEALRKMGVEVLIIGNEPPIDMREFIALIR
jgi:riboflavin biosynthesis pyrimidine reductase